MERHQRHTRKPRLFRVGHYKKASAAVLLTLGTQWAVASSPARAQTGALSGAIDASTAQMQNEATAIVAAESGQNGAVPARASVADTRRNPIGWAVALLLAGVAVGRHAVATDAEAD